MARADDPDTSWQAADSVENIRRKQAAVMECLESMGGTGTSEAIAAAYEAGVLMARWPRQSESGLRTRRSELVEMGLVADTGWRGVTVLGRPCVVWRLVKEAE